MTKYSDSLSEYQLQLNIFLAELREKKEWNY